MEELEVLREDGSVRAITFRPAGPDESGDEIRGYDPDHYDPEEDVLASLPGAELYRLVDAPEGATLERLAVSCPVQWEGNHGSWGSHAAFVKHLTRRARPALKLLELDGAAMPRAPSQGDAVPQLSHLQGGGTGAVVIDAGDFSKLWARAPGLEQFVVADAAKLKLGEIVAPALRTLVLGSSASAVPAAIARASLPALETLVVRVRRGRDVAAILASPGVGVLRHLGLIGDRSKPSRQGDLVIEALLASPRLEALETLDLGGWDASVESWRALVAAAPRLPCLTELRLSTWRLSVEDLAQEIEEGLLTGFKVCASRRGRPRDEPIGRELEAAFPVTWLTTTIEPVAEPDSRDVVYGFSSGLSLDDWTEVERRGDAR